MTARRRIIVVASVLVAIGLAAIAGQAIGEIPKTRFPSCLSPQPEGLLAFRRLLDDLVIPTVVLDRPWNRLNERDDQPPGMLIVALPLRRAVLDGESHELERWVRQGGSLLVVDDAGQNEEDVVLSELLRRIGIETYRQSTDLDPATLRKRYDDLEPLEFSHTLEEQIGGQLKAGFVITGYFEDRYSMSPEDPVPKYMTTCIATRAIKPA